MRRALAAAVALAALLLVGCSAIDRGTITAKVIEPATTIVQQVCAGYNAKGVCSVWVPQVIHDDEDYRFDIRNEDETGFVYVSREAFDEYEVGDFFEAAP
jgi:hypothetical protein